MSYTPIGWKDYPNKETPITAASLNKMDQGIADAHDTIGNKELLDTADTSDLVAAINEVHGDATKNAASIETLNNDLKEIYKEMYIPNVKRYTVSASLASTKFVDKVITFDEEIDLAHSKVNLVGGYRHDADGTYEAHPTYYYAQITGITSNNCTVSLKNNSSNTHIIEAIVEVEEWKKPTE